MLGMLNICVILNTAQSWTNSSQSQFKFNSIHLSPSSIQFNSSHFGSVVNSIQFNSWLFAIQFVNSHQFVYNCPKVTTFFFLNLKLQVYFHLVCKWKITLAIIDNSEDLCIRWNSSFARNDYLVWFMIPGHELRWIVEKSIQFTATLNSIQFKFMCFEIMLNSIQFNSLCF